MMAKHCTRYEVQSFSNFRHFDGSLTVVWIWKFFEIRKLPCWIKSNIRRELDTIIGYIDTLLKNENRPREHSRLGGTCLTTDSENTCLTGPEHLHRCSYIRVYNIIFYDLQIQPRLGCGWNKTYTQPVYGERVN